MKPEEIKKLKELERKATKDPYNIDVLIDIRNSLPGLVAALDEKEKRIEELETAARKAIPLIRHDGNFVSTPEIQAIKTLAQALGKKGGE